MESQTKIPSNISEEFLRREFNILVFGSNANLFARVPGQVPTFERYTEPCAAFDYMSNAEETYWWNGLTERRCIIEMHLHIYTCWLLEFHSEGHLDAHV